MGQEIKTLIKEIFIGIILYNLVLALAATIIYPSMTVYLGLLVGMAVAMAMFLHMSVTYCKAAEKGDPSAKNGIALGVVIRSVIYLGLLVFLLWQVPQINVIAVALAALGLKAAAYLQPVTHRILMKNKLEKEIADKDTLEKGGVPSDAGTHG